MEVRNELQVAMYKSVYQFTFNQFNLSSFS